MSGLVSKDVGTFSGVNDNKNNNNSDSDNNSASAGGDEGEFDGDANCYEADSVGHIKFQLRVFVLIQLQIEWTQRKFKEKVKAQILWWKFPFLMHSAITSHPRENVKMFNPWNKILIQKSRPKYDPNYFVPVREDELWLVCRQSAQ